MIEIWLGIAGGLIVALIVNQIWMVITYKINQSWFRLLEKHMDENIKLLKCWIQEDEEKKK